MDASKTRTDTSAEATPSLASGSTAVKTNEEVHFHPSVSESGSGEKSTSKDQSDFYALLDEFTETNDEELAKFAHIRIFKKNAKAEKYKCIKCSKKAKYFSEAERHYNEHVIDEFSSVREALKKAELDRQEDAKGIRHSELISLIKFSDFVLCSFLSFWIKLSQLWEKLNTVFGLTMHIN